MKQIIIILTVLFISACNNNPAPSQPSSASGDSTTKAGKDDKTILPSSCYVNFRNRDTVIISLSMSDTLVTGDLLYSYYQKDRNKGTIRGVVKGDTVIADYQFNAEGTTSVRQVVFLKRGDKLIEGFGDVAEENGKMIFTNRSSLVFDSSLVLNAADCASLPRVR